MKYRINLRPSFWDPELINDLGTQVTIITADKFELINGFAVFYRLKSEAERYGVSDDLYSIFKVLSSDVFIEITET